MRPIEKLQPGQNVTYMNSLGKMSEETIKPDYSSYGEAKMPLIGNIGNYCSYCESRREPGDLHVEHVNPKGKTGSPTAWKNFLLSCNICNSRKGTQSSVLQGCHLPSENNTMLDFCYEPLGIIVINPQLTGISLEHAQALADMVKLLAYPGGPTEPSSKDFRWRKRGETWEIASSMHKKYKAGAVNVDEVITAAHALGFWSVWFTIFEEDAVRKELINQFPGTAANCFDPQNGYAPIERNPGQEDPV